MEILKKWYVIVSAAFTAIYAIATVDSESISKNMSTVKEWYRASPAMTGSWSSHYTGDDEDTITANAWLESEDQTAFDLTTYDGSFEGVISTPAIRAFIRSTPQVTDYFLFQGTKDYLRHSGTGFVYEYIYGKKVLFAKIRLELDGEKLILKDITEGGSPLMPKQITLLRRADSPYGERFEDHVNAAGEEKMKIITELLNKHRKQNAHKTP